MYQIIKKYSRRVFLWMAACLSLTMSALAIDIPGAIPENQPAALISASVTPASGAVPSSEAVYAATKTLAVQKEQEARAQAFSEQLQSLLHGTLPRRTVSYNSDFDANEVVRASGRSLGQFKLTFYCPCVRCNGRSDGLTRIGTTAVEGRTIAVDPNVIPLGSRVYIDGYGVFIAEDTGGAIKSKKIDVFLDSHNRCFENGVAYADVYLLS